MRGLGCFGLSDFLKLNPENSKHTEATLLEAFKARTLLAPSQEAGSMLAGEIKMVYICPISI